MDEMYNSDITDSEIDIPEIGGGNEGGVEEPTPPEVPEEEPSTIPIVIWLKEKFPEVKWSDLEWIYEQSVNIWLESVFSLNYEIVEIPFEMRPRATTWLKKCCLFILNLNNITEGLPLTAYKENGISMTFDSSMLSNELRSTLPPPMAVVRGSKR